MSTTNKTMENGPVPKRQRTTDVVDSPNAMTETDKFHKKFHFWNYLPSEMKVECIDRMPFKERYFLQYTARAERNLLKKKSQKCFLRNVVFGKNQITIVEREEENGYTINDSTENSEGIQIEKMPYLLDFIWETCEVRKLTIEPRSFTDKLNLEGITKSIKEVAPISINEIDTSQELDMELTMVVMENSWKHLNNLCLNGNQNFSPAHEMLQHPLVKNVKKMILTSLDQKHLHLLLMEWIRGDIPKGTWILKEQSVPYWFFEDLLFELRENISSHDGNAIFISTANPDRKLFLWINEDIKKARIDCIIVPSTATISDCREYLRTFR